MSNYISFRVIDGTPGNVQLEVRMDGSAGVVTLPQFKRIIGGFIAQLEGQGEPSSADGASPSTENEPPPVQQLPVERRATLVDRQCPWIINGELCAPIEILFRPSTLTGSPAEMHRWNRLFRLGAKGNAEARNAFEIAIQRDLRANTYVFRLHSVLAWAMSHPDIDVDQLVLLGEDPDKRGGEFEEKLARGITESLTRKEHPLAGTISITDPVLVGELSRQPAPPPPTPSDYSAEALYGVGTQQEPKGFHDPWRTGNVMQDAQHAPKPVKRFSPEPGEEGNR